MSASDRPSPDRPFWDHLSGDHLSGDQPLVDHRVEVADGIRLHVRSWTGAQQRPFLLVHGLSSNARLWDGVAADLAIAGHPVHAVDLRSHGTSDAPDTGYDTTSAADDVAAIADALDVRGAVVAGQSWGGNVVVELAACFPDVVAALALVDGGWFRPSTEFADRSTWQRVAQPPSIDGTSAEDMRDYFTRAHPDWSPEAIDATMANVAIDPDGTVRRRLSIEHHMSIAMDMWDSPPHRFYSTIHIPVMLVPAMPLDPAEASARRERVALAAKDLGNATVREYAGSDHDIHAQHPDQLSVDLLALSRSLDQAAGR